MSNLSVTLRDGSQALVSFDGGQTLLSAIQQSIPAGLEAICGGSCACATCHVFIPDSDAPRLSPATVAESELLSSLEHCTGQSRLACQIRLDASHDGLTVILAPEE